MRILLVGINYAPDLIGAAKYNTELCEALAAKGHEVRVITAPPYYPAWSIPEAYRSWFYRKESINNVLITRAPIYIPKRPSGSKRLIHHGSFALMSMWPLFSQAIRWRPDVIFSVAPSLMSAALASWIARRIGAFSWLHVQDFEVDAAFDLGILRGDKLRHRMFAVERAILKSFDRVSTISAQMLSRLAIKGIHPDKILEFRNWTDTSKIVPSNGRSSFRKQLNLDETHFVGLYSGTMSNKQGLGLVLEAAQRLWKTHPSVRFVLCGEGPQKAALKESGGTHLNNVQFLDVQADDRFPELLAMADFHLVPQKVEATDLVLPSKLGGIFATGRPVIAMSAPYAGLAAEVAGAGLVIPPGDIEALADAVRKLAGDPELCNALGKGARETALARWDKTTILATIERALVTARESSNPAPSPHLLSPTQPLADL